jgi:hypothetical protein
MGAADRWRHLASAAEERAAKENAGVEPSESEDTTRVEVILDEEHMNTSVQGDDVVRVGHFYSETGSGQDSMRGVSLQLTGPGARLVPSGGLESAAGQQPS